MLPDENRSENVESGYRTGGYSEEVVTRGQIDKVKKHVKELEEEHKQLNGSESIEKTQEREEELKNAKDWLAKNVGLGGCPRRIDAEQEKARKGFAKNIADSIKKIAVYEPDLAKHLADDIKRGSFPGYCPKSPRNWLTIAPS